MQYIPLIISTAAILVSLYLAFHKEHRDDQSKESKESKDLSVAFAKMDVKQDSILSAVNEMRPLSRGMGVWTHNGSDFLRQTWAGLAAWGG